MLRDRSSRPVGLWLGLAFFIVMALLPPVLQATFANANSALKTLNTIGIYATLALSLNVILGQAGLYNMGHAAFFALGAYVTAILNTVYGVPILWTLPIAGLIAAAFGYLIAMPIIHLRGDYLLVVTIGVVEIVRIVLTNDIFGLTGGPNGIYGIARAELFGYVFRSNVSQFYLIWAFVAITVLLFYFLEHSRFGRALNYIKYDETAAEGNGIHISAYKIAAFTIGAFWAGMAGTLIAPFMRTITPETFTFDESIILFAIIVLAGGGNLVGVIVATFIVVGLPDVFTIFDNARLFVFGAALVLVMLLRPHGLFAPRRRQYQADGLVGKFPRAIDAPPAGAQAADAQHAGQRAAT